MYAVLVAVCGALAGCGKSSHTAPALVTKAQGLAYADTVNLNETDVPGWTRRSSGGEVKISRAAVEGARCAGAVDPHRLLVNRYSPIYHQQQGGSMQSYILVWPTATLADKNAKALLSARGIACFTREQPHEHNYKEAGVVVRQVLKSISRLPDPLPHAAYSFEWRTTWMNHVPAQPQSKFRGRTFASPAETFASYEDELGLATGPAQIYLVTHRAINSLSTVTEQDALLTIYERAETHKL